jgi:DNA-binding MarR family transcriptional regulator
MEPERRGKTFAAPLLAQIGAHAGRQFAERLSVLKLAPPHAGILRRLMQSPGISQRELAAALGMHASRLVAVVDQMESLGLLIRELNAEDRRTHSLNVTPKGRETMGAIAAISVQHNEALCGGLSEEERGVLVGLLQRIADQQGLTGRPHPGFSTLGSRRSEAQCDPAETDQAL